MPPHAPEGFLKVSLPTDWQETTNPKGSSADLAKLDDAFHMHIEHVKLNLVKNWWVSRLNM